MPSLSLSGRLALNSRDNGKNNRAHLINDLSDNDMRLLISILSEGPCERCTSLKIPHDSSCVKLAIKRLPDRLRSHAGCVSRNVLQRLPREYRAEILEMCPTHVQLRPELMYDIFAIFHDGERYIASMVEQLAAIPSFFADTVNLDRLAPLVVVAEASLMWAGTKEYRKAYAGCHRRTAWKHQKDLCSACMVARMIKSPELLSIIEITFWIRCNDPKVGHLAPPHINKQIAWIDECLKRVARSQRGLLFLQTGRLYEWLSILSHMTEQGHYVRPRSGMSTRRRMAKVVRYVQNEQAALSNIDSTATTRLVNPPKPSSPPSLTMSSVTLMHTSSSDTIPHDETEFNDHSKHLTYTASVYSHPLNSPPDAMCFTDEDTDKPIGVKSGTIFFDDDHCTGKLTMRHRQFQSPKSPITRLSNAYLQCSPLSGKFTHGEHSVLLSGESQVDTVDNEPPNCAPDSLYPLEISSMGGIGRTISNFLDELHSVKGNNIEQSAKSKRSTKDHVGKQ